MEMIRKPHDMCFLFFSFSYFLSEKEQKEKTPQLYIMLTKSVLSSVRWGGGRKKHKHCEILAIIINVCVGLECYLKTTISCNLLMRKQNICRNSCDI